MTVVTSVLAETPLAVAGIHGMEARVVKNQIGVLRDSFPIAAIKTGVLHSSAHVSAVVESLDGCEAPLIVDPAMLTATRESLLSQGAVEAYKELLFPIATLMTPNLEEARYLLGGEMKRVEEPVDVCAKVLHETYGCAVLVTGSHDEATGSVVDYMYHDGQGSEFSNPWVDLPYAHGTGCTFTSAVAAGLAHGLSLPVAVEQGERFIMHALQEAYRWKVDGQDLMVLNHLPDGVFGAE